MEKISTLGQECGRLSSMLRAQASSAAEDPGAGSSVADGAGASPAPSQRGSPAARDLHRDLQAAGTCCTVRIVQH
eukprot:10048676-Karenia_brevis.AAC.1